MSKQRGCGNRSRRTSTDPKPKKSFMDKYNAKTYDLAAEGYGNAAEWRGAFNERMGWEQAQRVKAEAQATGKWRSEFTIIMELADGITIGENSMWSEIKSAFRQASMNCHPDRTATHGKSKETAEEEFKNLSAAYTILERKYGKG